MHFFISKVFVPSQTSNGSGPNTTFQTTFKEGLSLSFVFPADIDVLIENLPKELYSSYQKEGDTLTLFPTSDSKPRSAADALAPLTQYLEENYPDSTRSSDFDAFVRSTQATLTFLEKIRQRGQLSGSASEPTLSSHFDHQFKRRSSLS